MKTLVVALVLILLDYSGALATSCSEDCVERCRRCAFGVCVTEPTCHTKCEIEKKVACATGQQIPHAPGPSDIDLSNPGKAFDAFCKGPFEAYVNSAAGFCANWGGRTDDLNLADQAKSILVGARIIPPNEFDGVDIRWCPLGNGVGGMTPIKDHIYLNPSLKNNISELATTLGHEMIHINQYRRWGSDSFQCRYAQELPKGTGRDNYVEDEAYNFEDHIRPIIQNYVSSGGQIALGGGCSTVYGICLLVYPAPVGMQCFCQGPPPASGQVAP